VNSPSRIRVGIIASICCSALLAESSQAQSTDALKLSNSVFVTSDSSVCALRRIFLTGALFRGYLSASSSLFLRSAVRQVLSLRRLIRKDFMALPCRFLAVLVFLSLLLELEFGKFARQGALG